MVGVVVAVYGIRIATPAVGGALLTGLAAILAVNVATWTYSWSSVSTLGQSAAVIAALLLVAVLIGSIARIRQGLKPGGPVSLPGSAVYGPGSYSG